ncbi:MAG: N-formylglutamate amidohydrolase [Cytophagales bacterium]
MLGYQIIEPTASAVPIVVSVPHCGTSFPMEQIDQYKSELATAPDDTDWFVDKLYDFAPWLGITMITAQYSRWVIDLNRDPQSKPLYTDGRIITALCPTTDFLGNPIYVDNRTEVATEEVVRRVEKYYWPYHQKLQELLKKIHAQFGCVLLWDCHSIRQYVPTIRKEKFPDLILGDADETSCSKALIKTSLKNLSAANYKLQHNDPFKGGYITRAYGKPIDNFFALQLEMSKVNYMDDAEQKYHDGRAEKVREVLKKNFEELIEKLPPSSLP